MDPTLERQRIVGSVGQFHRVTIRSSDLSLGLQLGIDRPSGRAGFIGVVAETGRDPLVVVDSSIAPTNNAWEVRSDGLWVEYVCETPFEHWSYGLEAFGLRVDDPAELLGRGFGYREPLGWELDFECGKPPAPNLSSEGTMSGYRQDGAGHGIVLFKDRQVEIDGVAVRQHWWNDHSDAEIGIGPDDGSGAEGIDVALPQPGGVWWFSTKNHQTTWSFSPAV